MKAYEARFETKAGDIKFVMILADSFCAACAQASKLEGEEADRASKEKLHPFQLTTLLPIEEIDLA